MRSDAQGFVPSTNPFTRLGQHPIGFWFVFSGEPVRLSPAGSNILRLLVSYGVFVPTALPVLGRLNSVNWANPDTARKVLTSLA